jgi:dTDP-glucose pyrophosphorylase
VKATIELASKATRVDTSALFLRESATMAQAVACIDRSRKVSIALVVDGSDRLINTLSDGDIRRGIMAGIRLGDCVNKLLQIKAATPHPLPVTALDGTDDETLLEIMQSRAVRQIPLVTPSGIVVDIVTQGDLMPEVPRALQAVVMAGGEGRRLRPLTEETPKPMLPVGGRPLMELIIDQLRAVGIRKFNIATHYHAQKIIDHFGNGDGFGVDIEYTREEAPLGTGGALGLMTPPTDPVLVINGDILTDIDFRAMHAFHEEHLAQLTVAVRRYEVQVPYGVVECDGVRLVGLREKPELNFFVNAGIYLLEPSVYRHIPANKHLNMTDLIDLLITRGESVVSFPVREYWLDIGKHADYERAQLDAVNGSWR